jgi:tetratricopeptide (TPR) repeat protein
VDSRDTIFFSTVIAASCLLGACTSSQESKPAVVSPVEQQQATKPEVPNEKSEPTTEKKENVAGANKDDYLHGVPLGIAIGLDDLNVKQTIKSQLNQKKKFLDLHLLQNYTDRVTKDDLMLLRSNDAKEVIEINLGGLGLNDNDLEALSGLPLTRLEIDGNDIKDLHALKGMTTLTNLKLCDDPINSDGMRMIASLPNLQSLDLPRTSINDSDLPQLYGLKKLRFVNLGACGGLTPPAVERLKYKIPKTEIRFDVASARKFKNGFDTLTNIASTLMEQGEYDEADASIAKFVGRWESEPTPPYELIVAGYRQRADCQAKMGRGRAQLQMLMKALEVYNAHLRDDQAIPDLEMQCADILDRMNDPKAALAMSEKADAFWKLHPPPPVRRWMNGINMSRIGYHLLHLDEYDKARRAFEKALQYTRQNHTEDVNQIAGCRQGLAWCDFKGGNAKSAVPILKEAIQTFEKKGNQSAQCEAERMLAEVYASQGNNKDAETLLKKGIEMPVSDEKREQAYVNLVAVLKAEEKQDEAQHYVERYEKVTGKKLPKVSHQM